MIISDENSARDYVASLCDAEAMEKLERFVSALREENALQNLVAKPTLEIAWQRHIADSAQLLEYVSRETGVWLDLGTGAGLPGLVLSIMRPKRPFVLVESRRKRVEWLERMRHELMLPKCTIAGQRLEVIEAIPAAVISARAFAPLPRLIDLSSRFSTEETTYLLPKGRSAAQELQVLPKKFRKLFHVEQSRTDSEAGILVGTLAQSKAQRRKA